MKIRAFNPLFSKPLILPLRMEMLTIIDKKIKSIPSFSLLQVLTIKVKNKKFKITISLKVYLRSSMS